MFLHVRPVPPLIAVLFTMDTASVAGADVSELGMRSALWSEIHRARFSAASVADTA